MRFPRLPRLHFFAVLFAAIPVIPAFCQSYDTPDWLTATMNLATPENAAHAPAVILLDDTSLEMDAKGVLTEIHREAIRILHISGRDYAAGHATYDGKADRVLEANAWLFRDGKQPRPVKKGDWIDIATNDPGTAIDEYRSKQIDLSGTALAGDVFGYETRVRRPMVVAQLRWSFGALLPIATERLSLAVPPGFSIDDKMFGANQPTLSHSGNTWTWTSTDRPYRPNEPYLDPTARDDADLLINCTAPAGSAAGFPRSFSTWQEVTSMYESLNQGQCDSSAELVAKTHSLTAGCATTLDKIRALGAYVQKIRYIEINEGLRYGYGWKARKASFVFSNGYGDCKDKANLLIAMLREAGIKAHLVIAMIDPDHGFVAHSEFPGPMQFNHAIAGIEVDSSIQLPAVVETEKSGRLLFFDPTDPYTQVGDLPYLIQGTNVQVAENGITGLTRLPRFDAAHDFLVQRHVALTISASETGITAAGQISAAGQSGASLRSDFEKDTQPTELEKLVTHQLSDAFRGALVEDRKTEDNPLLGLCTLSFTCQHPRFVQRLPGNGLVVKLDVLSRHYLPNFSENERRLPIQLQPVMIQDEVVLKLTGGYTVDEVPRKISFESPYGSYAADFSLMRDALVMKRTITIKYLRVPAENYAAVRKFLTDIVRADRSSVLLKKGT
ncbi:MAG TPA: transglutaminase domain-containing protein [Candidatus Udaeobacter sp.]|jgi:hypothetical protein